MSMTPDERNQTRLAKLDAKIAEAKAQKRRLLGAEARDRRKLENRRKVLAGAAVLDEAARNPEYRASLWALLGRFLLRPDERALFGFEPLPSRPELVVNHPALHGGDDGEQAFTEIVEKREAEPA
jgi:hypothetical protein